MTYIPGIYQPIPSSPFYPTAAEELTESQWPMVYTTDGPLPVSEGIAFTTEGLVFDASYVTSGLVTKITAVSPLVVDDTDPSVPEISIADASTTGPGVVQLNDTVSSSSTAQALTANQGKLLQDQINAISASNNLTLAGTIDASTGNLLTATVEGAAAGFSIGGPLPAPAAGNEDYFVIVTVAGTMTPPGGAAQLCDQGDWWLSNGAVWEFLNVGFNATYATTTSSGVVQLATDAEVQAGTEATHAVTSAGLQSKLSDSTTSTSTTTIASSQAVKTVADASVPKSLYSTKGSILFASSASTPTALALGSTGEVLTVDSTGEPTWSPSQGLPTVSTGSILVGSTTGNLVEFPVGANGQVLQANSSSENGVRWAAISSAPPVTQGIVGNFASVSLGNLALRYNNSLVRVQWRWSISEPVNGHWVSAQGFTGSVGPISQNVTVGTWYEIGINLSSLGGVLTIYIGNLGTRMYRATVIKGSSTGDNTNITIEQLTGY